jgi:hypothetical protein
MTRTGSVTMYLIAGFFLASGLLYAVVLPEPNPGAVAFLVVLNMAWMIPLSAEIRGVQPKGKVKPYPPRPVPPMVKEEPRPRTTECAYCGTAIIPGSLATACSGCGAAIRPIAAPPSLEEAAGAIVEAFDKGRCLEWEELRGDGRVVTRTCTRWAQKVPPPGPPTTIYGRRDDFVPIGQAIIDKVSAAIMGAHPDAEFKRELDELEESARALERQRIEVERFRHAMNDARSLRRHEPDLPLGEPRTIMRYADHGSGFSLKPFDVGDVSRPINERLIETVRR